MKTPGFRLGAGLGCFGLALLSVEADDSLRDRLPHFAYRPAVAESLPAPSAAGVPNAAKNAMEQMPVVTVLGENHVFQEVNQAVAQREYGESCALIKNELPGSRTLEEFLAPENTSGPGRDPDKGHLFEAAEFPLVRLRW